MKTMIRKYWQWALSLLFAASVTVFWAVPYACALSFQEQYQLFLFDSDYLWQRLSVPGGLSDYIAEFLTQFNYVNVAGACILGVLFLLLQRLTWHVTKQLRPEADGQWYVLSFLPAIVLWAYMGDEHVMLSFAVSLLAALVFMWWYAALNADRISERLIFLLAVLPAFYWLFGASVWCVVLFAFVTDVACRRKRAWLPAAAVVWMIAAAELSALFLPYPLYRLFGGLDYYRYPAFVPVMQWVVMLFFAVIPVLTSRLPQTRHRTAVVSSEIIVMAVVAVAGVKAGFKTVDYDMIEYDYLVRTHQWDRVLEKAQKQQPSTPLEVACVNLSLGMRGELLDHMFEYYQNGGEGLFPTFNRDPLSPLPTSELFYELGMINDAERYAFEAQEAIPNFRKSGRLMKRIVQCEMINGNYGVARKYLDVLAQSLFYGAWAQQQLDLIAGGDKAVATDSEYAQKRKLRIKHTDFLFSDREMDQMLGMLFVDGKKYDNRMAYEYLIAYELLQRDLPRFMEYYPLGRYVSYDHIPYAVQQMLTGNWLQKHGTLRGMPFSVDQQNAWSTAQFLSTYSRNHNDPSLSVPPLSYNVWHYMLLQGGTAKKAGKAPAGIY